MECEYGTGTVAGLPMQTADILKKVDVRSGSLIIYTREHSSSQNRTHNRHVQFNNIGTLIIPLLTEYVTSSFTLKSQHPSLLALVVCGPAVWGLRRAVRGLEVCQPALYTLQRLLLHGQHRRVNLAVRRAEIRTMETIAYSDRLFCGADGGRSASGGSRFAPRVS